MTEPAALPTLHLVFSEAGYRALEPLLEGAVRAPTIVLLQDACYLLRDQQQSLPDSVLGLAEDLALRGVTLPTDDPRATVTTAELVQLTCNHQPIVSWG